MKTVIRIIKGIGYGLFKLHLWLPLIYSAIFIAIALAMEAEDFWIGYFIGLAISLVCSIGIIVYFGRRKAPDGEYKKKKETERKSLIYENGSDRRYENGSDRRYENGSDRRYSYDRASEPSRSAEPPGQVRVAPAPPSCGDAPQPNYRELLYKDFDREQARQDYRQSQRYEKSASLYEDGYGYSENRISGADARAKIYGDESDADRRQPRGRSDIYPQDYGNENAPQRQNRREELYPDKGDGTERRQSKRDELYPNEGRERQKFDEYRDFRRPNDGIYSQNDGNKGFTAYVQPVNSTMPNRPNVSDNSEALEAAGFKDYSNNNQYDNTAGYNAAGYNGNLQNPREDSEAVNQQSNEFSQNSGLNLTAQRTVIGRRRETPLQIYATRSDQNLYVYEYSDRYEYIKLLEGGNKQLLKTEFKA